MNPLEAFPNLHDLQMPSESRELSCHDQNQSEGSQNNSSSDDIEMNVSRFLEAFPNPPMLMPSGRTRTWVFCSRSENNFSSADLGTHMINIIQDKITSAFSHICFGWLRWLAQFWAPIAIDGRLLLSTSGQPFAVSDLTKYFSEYRVDSEKYKYNIDVTNKLHIEGELTITTAFFNRLPFTIPSKDDDDERWKCSFMLPICLPSESSCVGVLELIVYITEDVYSGTFVLDAIEDIKKAGLDVCNVQEQIPYKKFDACKTIAKQTINGLRLAKDEIKHALEIVCGSHNLNLAQVWIAFKDKSHYLEDTQRTFGLKLTGYLLDDHVADNHITLMRYSSFCDVMPLGSTEELALKTLQDFKSRYTSTFYNNVSVDCTDHNHYSCALVICLRSRDMGDFNFAFEFVWLRHSKRDIMLESILLTLKRCLPSFRFACGSKLGDELDVIEVSCSKYNLGIISVYDEICNFKIFQRRTSSPIPKALEEGKPPGHKEPYEMICKTTREVLRIENTKKQLDLIGVESPSCGETSNIKVFQGKRLSPICKSVEEANKPMVKCKTAEILLTREDIEKQFDKTMKEAAENLKVSQSTLKRKLRKLGIQEWPRTKHVKRNKNEFSINQIDINEEVSGAIQESSTRHIIIEAQYVDDMIVFPLLMSEASFVTLEEKIGMKFKLSVGTYKFKYVDEVGRKILLTSDEEMSYCIESSRKPDGRIVVQLSVQLCTQTN